jgi:hypothetical protein
VDAAFTVGSPSRPGGTLTVASNDSDDGMHENPMRQRVHIDAPAQENTKLALLIPFELAMQR